MLDALTPNGKGGAMEQAEFYQIRKGHEWALICLHEPTGLFLAQSSFGTFGYIWAHRGGQSLKEFLADLYPDYFFGKACERTRGQVFDDEGTIRCIKERVLEERRFAGLSKERAREIFDSANEVEGCGQDEVMRALYESKPIYEFFGGDIPSMSKMDPQCRGFWEKIWPEFLDRIKSEAIAA